MHNAKFDLDVMNVHLDIASPSTYLIHDTTWVLFLHDPNMKNLGLKESAEESLGWPADERNTVAEWLCENQPVPGVRISRGKKSEFYYMKYLAWCPSEIVGPYANGDTDRTAALFEKLYPDIIARGMGKAYEREQRLMPVLLAMERRGVRVDLDRLRKAVADYGAIQVRIDAWLQQRLGKSRFFNLDGDEFVTALLDAGLADKDMLGLTATGKTATNKHALANGVTDKQVAAVLQYRAQLHTCMATFLFTWLGMAEASGGFVYSTWNQVRGEGKGARTGRLSSSPNFQNIAKEFSPIFQHEQKGLPRAPLRGLLQLPQIRSFVVPHQEDHALIDRDYHSQEIRILAHFGDGALLSRYKEDPWLDAHTAVKNDLFNIAKIDVSRNSAKVINFGILYGMGISELARRLGASEDEARRLKRAVISLYPEIGDLYATMKQLARENKPLVTFGGRENFCEPPTKGIDWSYKLVNTLVQGSAGDITKEAMIRYSEAAPADHHMLLSVHDQLCASVPAHEVVRGHRIMREAMESLELDVKLLSEGKWSLNNWSDLQPFDKHGKFIAKGLPEQGDA